MSGGPDREPAARGKTGAGQRRTVTSLQNPVLKLVRSLELRKARRETGLFIAEGVKVVATARDRAWTPQLLLVNAEESGRGMVGALADWALRAGADCIEVPAHLLAKFTTRDNPQNVVGVFSQRLANALPAQVPADGLWVALDQVRDPGNLGTIIRTADAVGASGVVLVGACCDPYSREAVRASMGSIFNVALAGMTPAALLARLQTWPGPIVGADVATHQDFRGDYKGPVLLIMGSEGSGLSKELAGACTRLVKIPMAGHADSLNLAIATALLLYEIRGPALQV